VKKKEIHIVQCIYVQVTARKEEKRNLTILKHVSKQLPHIFNLNTKSWSPNGNKCTHCDMTHAFRNQCTITLLNCVIFFWFGIIFPYVTEERALVFFSLCTDDSCVFITLFFLICEKELTHFFFTSLNMV
jgi:hypothetical protein